MCLNCGHWYDAKKSECPLCGKPKHAFNKWLRTAQLNANLYEQAERSEQADTLRY